MTPDAFQTVVDLANERAERLNTVQAILHDWIGGRISPGEALTQIARAIHPTSRASEVILQRPGKGELQERSTIEQERVLLEARLQAVMKQVYPAPGPATEAAQIQAGFAALSWVLNDPDPQPAGRLFAALTSRP